MGKSTAIIVRTELIVGVELIHDMGLVLLVAYDATDYDLAKWVEENEV